MKLPTSLGGMGIRAVTPQLDTSFETTVNKTRTQADRIENSQTGKQRDKSWESGTERYEMLDGTQNVEHEDRSETMTGPFKWDLVNASKGHGFFILHQPHHENTRDHRCAQNLVEIGHY